MNNQESYFLETKGRDSFMKEGKLNSDKYDGEIKENRNWNVWTGFEN